MGHASWTFTPEQADRGLSFREIVRFSFSLSFFDSSATLRSMSFVEKIIPSASLTEWRESIRSNGRRLVVTNGCFDILHAGHVTYLAEARQLGDVLLVGINSDRSTRALKGVGRPVHSENDRALVIAALEFVSFVTVFDQLDAIELLEAAKPDIYVKGGDYTLASINQDERRLVEEAGGEVKILSCAEGRSTSQVLAESQAARNQPR